MIVIGNNSFVVSVKKQEAATACLQLFHSACPAHFSAKGHKDITSAPARTNPLDIHLDYVTDQESQHLPPVGDLAANGPGLPRPSR